MRFIEYLVTPWAWDGHNNHLDGTLPLTGLTVVLGANNTGKTTLLEMLEDSVTNEPAAGRRPTRRLQRQHDGRHPRVKVQLDISEGSSDVEVLRGLERPDGEDGSVGEMTDDEGLDALLDALASYALEESIEDAITDSGGVEYEPPLIRTADEGPPMRYFRDLIESGSYYFEHADPEMTDWFRPVQPQSEPYREFWMPQVARVEKSERERALPPLVSAPAEEFDVSQLTEQLLETIIEDWFGVRLTDLSFDDASRPPVSPWLNEAGDEFTAGLMQLVRILEGEVERLLPSFVHTLGTFRIDLLEPARWTSSHRVLSVFDQNGVYSRAEATGSGIRRWLAVCLRLAASKVRRFYTVDRYRDGEPPIDESRIGPWTAWRDGFDDDALVRDVAAPLLLVDEPELHLHPDAQQVIGRWFRERLAAGDLAGCVAATHSPALLRGTGTEATIVVLRRGEDRTTLEVLDDEVLSEFDAMAQKAGMGREAWFFSTNAVLAVEGQHDLEVLQRFYGRLLGRLRVRVLPLRGAKNAQRLVDSEFLGASGLPLYVLFDNVRLGAIRGTEDQESASDEERMMRSVLKQADKDDITFLPYEEPDILCALPTVLVERRYDQSTRAKLRDADGYWTEDIAAWRAEQAAGRARTSFKRWVAEERLGLSPGTDLVRALLGVVTDEDRPSPALAEAMRALEAHVADRDLLL